MEFSSIQSFADAVDEDPPFAGQGDACQTYITLLGKDEQAKEELMVEFSDAIPAEFQDRPFH